MENDELTLSELQSRRTFLLYKKAEWLTTPEEDAEYENICKLLENYATDMYGCA